MPFRECNHPTPTLVGSVSTPMAGCGLGEARSGYAARGPSLAVMVALGLVIAHTNGARAQSQPTSPTSPANGQTQAAPTAGNAVEQLQEVVVTAEKRSERLQDAPVAVVVLNPTALATTNAGSMTDLNSLVPSVEFQEALNNRPTLGMRGISSDATVTASGAVSGVEIAVDGVPVPWDSYGAAQLEDVASIEVLEGPQSTLGGRAASAGEINVLTHGPSRTFTGSASATFTNDNEEHLQLYLAGPLSDTLSFSVVGWGHNTQMPQKNLYDDHHTRTDDEGLRAKLRWQPTDNLDITLSGRYSLYETYGDPYVYTYIQPGQNCLFVGRNPPCSPGFPTSQQNLLAGFTPSFDNLDYNSQATKAGSVSHDTDGMLVINYDLGGGYSLSSTTDVQREVQANTQDVFVTAQNSFDALTGCGCWDDTQQYDQTVLQKSEELKLLSPTNQALSYLVGFFYSDTTTHASFLRTLPAAAYDYTVIPDTATYDLYGRLTWQALTDTKVILGLRENHDDLSYKYIQTVSSGIPDLCTYCVSSGSDDSSSLLGDLTLQQQLAENSMAYFKYSRGYAPKAYNTTATLYCADALTYTGSFPEKCAGSGAYTPAATLQPVDQETINSFELGSKGTYFDKRVSVNADVFFTKYTNYQVEALATDSAELNPASILTAAGAAETKGVELNTVFAVAADTTVGFNAAYIDAKFTDYKGAACWETQTAAQGCTTVGTVSTQDISGDPLPNAPKFKFTLNASQTVRMDTMPFDLVFGGNYVYRTSAQMDVDQNPLTVQRAYGILDLNVAAQSKNGNYKATVFVNNVTDQHYFTDIEDFWSPPWGANAIIAQPARDSTRYFGIRFDASF